MDRSLLLIYYRKHMSLLTTCLSDFGDCPHVLKFNLAGLIPSPINSETHTKQTQGSLILVADNLLDVKTLHVVSLWARSPFLMLSGVLFILLAFIILEDNFLFKICPLTDAESPEDKTGT